MAKVFTAKSSCAEGFRRKNTWWLLYTGLVKTSQRAKIANLWLFRCLSVDLTTNGSNQL